MNAKSTEITSPEAPAQHPASCSRIKRTLDIVGAVVLAGVTAPFLALAALAVRVRMGSPIFFFQQRTGMGGKTILVAKLRTMTNERDRNGEFLPDAARLTPLGKLLRATSLDEIPQLLAVLSGKMSLVGPRPLPTSYLPRYSEQQRRRHLVRPGITGLTQVRGRNNLDWEQKFQLDLEYVDRWSLALDLAILASTAGVVLSRRGIHAEGEATMDEFLGNPIDPKDDVEAYAEAAR